MIVALATKQFEHKRGPQRFFRTFSGLMRIRNALINSRLVREPFERIVVFVVVFLCRTWTIMTALPSDLGALKKKVTSFSEQWLKELDISLQEIAKGIMAERQEIVCLKNSLKKALDENKVLKAKLRFAETSKLYKADSGAAADATPMITVAEHTEQDASNGVEMLLVFRTLLSEMGRSKESALLIEMYKLTCDPDDRLKHVAELVVEMTATKPSFCGLYAQFCKQLASLLVSKSHSVTCEKEDIKFDKILLEKISEELNVACYSKIVDKDEEEESEDEDSSEDDEKAKQSKAKAKFQRAKDKVIDMTHEKHKFLAIIRLIGELYLQGNKICMTREFVHNTVRKLVADFNSANVEYQDIPLEGIWTLMRIINGKLRDDYKSIGKTLQYMTPFLRLEQIVNNRKMTKEGQNMNKEILALASFFQQ